MKKKTLSINRIRNEQQICYPEVELFELDGHDILTSGNLSIPEIGYEKNLLFNGYGEFDRGFDDREKDLFGFFGSGLFI